MRKGWMTYLQYGNYFCGVEHTSQNGKEVLYTTVIKKKGNSLDLKDIFQSTSVGELAPILPKKQHLCLVINNENVITKPLESSETDALKLIYKSFPNINLDDFYYEILIQNGKRFIAICRRAYVDELVTAYTDLGYHTISLTLGNNIVSSVIPYINSPCILTSNKMIWIENKSITKLENIDLGSIESYNINGLNIQNNYILSFAGALNCLLGSFHTLSNLNAKIVELREHFKHTRFFNQFLKFGLVFILTMLLINFFFFNYYFNQVQTLQLASQSNQTAKSKIIKLSEQIATSQTLAEDILKSKASKSSFYVNTIVKSLPNSILLSKLDYQPLEQGIKKDKPLAMLENTMVVNGETHDGPSFSKWIADLESIDWIDQVEILNYEDTSANLSSFGLKIRIGND